MTEFADAIQDETLPETATETRDTAPPSALEHDIYQESIECELTEADKAERRVTLESVDREIIRLEEAKKASAKVFTNQIKPLEAQRESILAALDSGTEKRLVDCYELVDERLGKVEIRRVDTDEVVEERAMTASEREEAGDARQGDLFGCGSSMPPPDLTDPATDHHAVDDDPEDDSFEPDPEALALAATDEGRVVKTTSAEARKRKAKRTAAPTEGDAAE